jgi:hypothetical protein
VLLAGLAQLLGPFGMGMFFGGGVFLVEDGAGGTHIHAFAAGGAAFHLPPGLVEPRHDPAFSTAVGHIPHMGPLDLITNAHAATTENAAVVVNGEELVKQVTGHDLRAEPFLAYLRAKLERLVAP